MVFPSSTEVYLLTRKADTILLRLSLTELQIGEGIEDKFEDIFSFFFEEKYVVTPH